LAPKWSVKNKNKLIIKYKMINWDEFDKMFDNMFSFKSDFFNDNNWTKRTYKSPDGKYSFTYMSKGFNSNQKSDELDILKNELEKSVAEQEFEKSVELRDKIKTLEKNKEKISELEKKLSECVEKQDYEKAIEYRDKINALK
jgi:excinuclease UvrABC helicase subunit UvrB